MTTEDVLKRLKEMSNPSQKDLDGMARFGINIENAWCISMPKLRKFGKEICKQVVESDRRHWLAQEVWETGIHEARILAALIDDPEKVTEKQMEMWVKDFDSWDVCDQVCSNLFDKTKFAYIKAKEWAKREEEFVIRAGFVLMAVLAVHDKKANDEKFYDFLKLIHEEAIDERNFVKKAVNWALREISKMRTSNLYNLGLETAKEIQKIDSKSAKWIANDAIRELEKEYIKKRFIDDKV